MTRSVPRGSTEAVLRRVGADLDLTFPGVDTRFRAIDRSCEVFRKKGRPIEGGRDDQDDRRVGLVVRVRTSAPRGDEPADHVFTRARKTYASSSASRRLTGVSSKR